MVALPTHSKRSVPFRPPEKSLYIDGVLQQENTYRIERLLKTNGFDDVQLTILKPLEDYKSRPFRLNARVELYLNRRIRPRPQFRGFVVGYTDQATPEDGEFISVECRGEMFLLLSNVCDRDYNDQKTDDTFAENLTVRQIVEDIHDQIRIDSSSIVQFAKFTFPNNILLSSLALEGQPFLSALEQTLEAGSENQYYIRTELFDDHTLVSAFQIGTGNSFNLIRSTDSNFYFYDNADGQANVQSITRSESIVDVVNEATVVGQNILYETSIPLTAGWPTAKEFYLDDLELYTDKGSEDDPNEDYDPEAVNVARRFIIPEIDTGSAAGYLEFPRIEGQLTVNSILSDQDATQTVREKPFVVYKFADEAGYRWTQDISVSENILITNKPLVKEIDTDGLVIDPTLPSEVYLEGAFRLRDKLRVPISRTGNVPSGRDIHRWWVKEEFEYWERTNYWNLELVGLVITPVLYATTDIVKDNTVSAQTWGQNRLKYTADKRLEIVYHLPYIELGLEIGMRVRENGLYEDCNIMSLDYDLINLTTTATALSR